MCGALLVPWIGILIEQLHGEAGKRSFSSSWVGLDVLESVCLLTVALLLSRRHRATSPAAAATAAILCMDAWFDTMSAAPQLPYVESLGMACRVELPLAALLAWTAWRALEWAAPRAAAVPFSSTLTARLSSRKANRQASTLPSPSQTSRKFQSRFLACFFNLPPALAG